MAATILDAIQNIATPEMVDTARSTLGLSEAATTSALGAASTGILGGLIQKSGNASTMAAVAALVSGVKPDADLFANMAGFLTGGPPASSTQVAGNKLLGAVFGDKGTTPVTAVAFATGVSPQAASGLTTLAAPMVLSALRAQLGATPSASDLTKLLADNRSIIAANMPAALRTLYGLAEGASAPAPAVEAPKVAAVTPAPVAPAPAPVAAAPAPAPVTAATVAPTPVAAAASVVTAAAATAATAVKTAASSVAEKSYPVTTMIPSMQPTPVTQVDPASRTVPVLPAAPVAPAPAPAPAAAPAPVMPKASAPAPTTAAAPTPPASPAVQTSTGHASVPIVHAPPVKPAVEMAPAPVAKSMPPVAAAVEDESEGWGLLPLIGLLLPIALLVGLIWYWAYGDNLGKGSVTSAVKTIARQAPVEATPSPTPAPAPAVVPTSTTLQPVAAPNGLIHYTLPNGAVMDVDKDGLEYKLISFISNKDAVIDTKLWFDFDHLNFVTGSSELTGESKAQVANAVAILKAYPAVAIKIGGYTDSQGDPDANLKLSDLRANAVMASMVAAGIDASRLEAKGYGDAFPIGDNATAEGRAKNRRTSLSVRAK